MMHEEHGALNYPFPERHFSQAFLARVDQVLLAVAGRLWEGSRDTTPHGRQVAQTTWPVTEMRTSPLGQCLLLIADYASGGYAERTQVEQAMQRVSRTLFGDPLGEGYILPPQFHTTDLGKLFGQARGRMYRRADLMTPTQVARDLGFPGRASMIESPMGTYTRSLPLLVRCACCVGRLRRGKCNANDARPHAETSRCLWLD